MSATSAKNHATPRRVCFVTGARSEYDLLVPVARAVNARAGLTAEFIVAGAHMSPFHGMGIEQIRADGFRIAATIESLLSSESPSGRALSFSHLTEGLVRHLSVDRPDVLFVAGDREEALAAALAGTFLGIPVAHAFGGDRCMASDIDEIFRPAISKLAHLHFTATEGHRERLIRMGERPEFVWAVGGTGLDRLHDEEDVDDAALSREFGVDVRAPFFLLIHHPTPTFGTEGSEREMSTVLDAALALGYPVFCSYPNFDPGNIGIRKAIDAARARSPLLRVHHNLPRRQFVALYRRCAAIAGNSSSIVIEAGFLHRPGVLIGPRQDHRETGANVVRVPAEAAAIRAALERAVHDAAFKATCAATPSLYGDGQASGRIAEILATVPLERDLLLKMMTY